MQERYDEGTGEKACLEQKGNRTVLKAMADVHKKTDPKPGVPSDHGGIWR